MKKLPPILIAEDNEDDVLFIQQAFAKAKIENPLHVAPDGQEAIDYLGGTGKFADRDQFPLPCMVILDLKMPRKSGMEVLEWRAAQPILDCIPAMVLSSSAHRYDIELAYKLGANAFVVKPLSVKARVDLARFIKGFWIEFNTPPIVCTEGVEAAVKLQVALDIPRTLLRAGSEPKPQKD